MSGERLKPCADTSWGEPKEHQSSSQTAMVWLHSKKQVEEWLNTWKASTAKRTRCTWDRFMGYSRRGWFHLSHVFLQISFVEKMGFNIVSLSEISCPCAVHDQLALQAHKFHRSSPNMCLKIYFCSYSKCLQVYFCATLYSQQWNPGGRAFFKFQTSLLENAMTGTSSTGPSCDPFRDAVLLLQLSQCHKCHKISNATPVAIRDATFKTGNKPRIACRTTV